MQASNQMHGKLCMVTGATAGIGEVTALALAEKGASVVLVGRDPAKGAATVDRIRSITGNPEIHLMLADFSVLQQVRRLAEDFTSQFQRLDVLVNNAGAMFLTREENADGMEMTFVVNHLAPFLLTGLLLDTLKASAPARIVNVASGAHRRAPIDFADLHTRHKYAFMEVYGKSKLANLLFTY